MTDSHDRRTPNRRSAKPISECLTHLITTLHPDERTRPGYARLAKDIREATGGTLSGTYLWELATGKKHNVTVDQLGVLAQYFGVPPEYFFSAEVADRVNTQLRLATALRDNKVRSLALRAEGLSGETLDALLAMVDQARRLHHLPDIEETPPYDAAAPAPTDHERIPADGES
ncbi:hypothetical protein OH797_01220 [Streptomyces anulatus]|uniref:hypothetical protein n=1 Tax=Streptomyces TaxID=1883 RepID=UPI0006DB232C|nr:MULTISPECIES: hypothetical protein [Streptomyces]MDF9808762.1 transcriptional regulator with XRE-family HTH domain [Streptomyces sp. HB372]KPL30465.1 hypothetical protein JI76_36465 [Streptomyces anulatus]OKI78151.1 hypothetical protein AMK12_19485 [Streptomyces sp. TSRI0395]WSC66065.1 hypothetical protein OHA57_37210 [Streptomyces anulatus]WSR80497.1 hypothetical protein OG274_36970 [Streptomyces anulatus]